MVIQRMFVFRSILYLILMVFTRYHGVTAIKCLIGWGQTGLEYKYGEEWPRDCSKKSNYCFRATTQDVKQAARLIDFTWDSYYATFYFKGCGGQWGTPFKRDKDWPYHGPFAGKINITTPVVETGQGSQETLVLDYTCLHDMCSSATRWWGTSSSFSLWLSPLVVTAMLLMFSIS